MGKKKEIINIGEPINRSLTNLVLDLVELDPDSPENQDLINEKINSIGVKVESYVFVNNETDMRITMVKEEINRLRAVQKRLEGLQESLKQRAIVSMEIMGLKQLKSELGQSMTITESTAVNVTNFELLPAWAIRKKVIVEPEKMAIREALSAGRVVPGAELITNKTCRFTKGKKNETT